MAEKNDKFAQEFADAITKRLEKGVEEWQRGWNTLIGEGGLPRNHSTGNDYTGMNSMRLALAQMENGYTDSRWLTFKQTADLGGHVKKGEHGTTIQVVLPRHYDTENKRFLTLKEEKALTEPLPDHIEKRIQVKAYTVFNVQQTDGIPELKPQLKEKPNEIEVNARAEAILKNSGANIQHVLQNSAYYSPREDKIVLPEKQQFKSAAHYYDTALHELGHWTGHKSRLDRPDAMTSGFGSPAYAKEELRAEISSWMTAAKIGLPHNSENHASYIDGWIKAIKDNPNTLIEACRDADKISKYVLQFDKEHQKQAEADKKQDKTFTKDTENKGLTKEDVEKLKKATPSELKQIKDKANVMLEQTTRLADRITSKTNDIAAFEAQKVAPQKGGFER